MRRALFVLFILISAITVIADTYVLEPVDATLHTPGTIILNVVANTTQPVYGIELTVKDTPERAVFSHVETTSRTISALATYAAQGTDISKLAIILSGVGSGITAGNGSILKIYYSASSGTGSVNFQTLNFKVYDKNGSIIPGNSITGATITLESSASSSSGSSGGSGGGGGGGGSGGGSSSSSSTSASTSLPFSFPETKPAKEKPAPTQPPKVIEISTAPAEIPAPEKKAAQSKPVLPWIIGVLVFLAGSVLIIYVYKKQSGI
jgi:uncharacterized membrane protein YgcG